ncbi:MAG: glycosyltransferase family 2 protein [Chloroflexota bacterium]
MKSLPRAPQLSVVIPIYNEEENVPRLHEELRAALDRLERPFEIVYVDDGSRDASPQRLSEIAAVDPHVRVVLFRRNFGQTAAIQAGIDHSRGEYLVFMDGDLQNDPADIGRLLQRIDEGFDLVSGWRKDRKDALLSRKLPSRLANSLISRVTGVHLNDYGCTLKAYRREVLANVRLYGEMHRFIPAYASWQGASITEIPVNHRERRYGKSKYRIWRTFRVLLDLLTVKLLGSYGTKPIYLFGSVGLLLWALALVGALEVLGEKFGPGHVQAHNNPVLLLAVFLGLLGVQSVMLGLLAELAIRTYHESGGRTTYTVRRIIEGSAPAPSARSRAKTG